MLLDISLVVSLSVQFVKYPIDRITGSDNSGRQRDNQLISRGHSKFTHYLRYRFASVTQNVGESQPLFEITTQN